MADTPRRKTFFILGLASALIIALAEIVTDQDLQAKLGSRYYILSLSIIGCVLLVLAGYVWDRTLLDKLKALRDTVPQSVDPENAVQEQDEIIGLARKIERMAQALQQTEASYRGIVEDQIDLICRYRIDGKVTFVNRAYSVAMGRERSELVGQPFLLAYEAGPVEREAWTLERELEYPDGNRRWLLWTIRAIPDRDGRPIQYQAVGHDITIRKEAEAALVQAKEAAETADRAKTEFLAMVSHEIRTPISGVIGFAEVLSESGLTDEQKEQVGIIKSSAQALAKLIADILDLSKIEAGKIDIESGPFALRQCIQDVLAFFLPKARAAALTLTGAIDQDVPSIVSSDEARLRQILTNLVGNALKFTDQGGIALRVSCSKGEPGASSGNRRPVRIFFSVSDTGIGIAENRLADLFRPFSQVDSSPDRRRSGTGLGLIISKRLCELMGGSISVESSPGRGTTFHFSVLADYQKSDSAPPLAARVPAVA